MPNDVRIVYEAGSRSVQEIQSGIDAVFDDLARDPAARRQLEGADLAAARRGIVVEIRDAGVDADLVTVIVSFAPAGNYVLASLWRDVILPRLQARLGGDVLGDEIDAE